MERYIFGVLRVGGCKRIRPNTLDRDDREKFTLYKRPTLRDEEDCRPITHVQYRILYDRSHLPSVGFGRRREIYRQPARLIALYRKMFGVDSGFGLRHPML